MTTQRVASTPAPCRGCSSKGWHLKVWPTRGVGRPSGLTRKRSEALGHASRGNAMNLRHHHAVGNKRILLDSGGQLFFRESDRQDSAALCTVQRPGHEKNAIVDACLDPLVVFCHPLA